MRISAILGTMALTATAVSAQSTEVERLRREVQGIRLALQSVALVGSAEADTERRHKLFERLRELVGARLVAEVEAEPSVSQEALAERVERVLGATPLVTIPAEIFRKDGFMVVLAYTGDEYFGAGGARTVVEGYSFKAGKGQLVGRGGSELNGADTKPAVVEGWILAQGQITWASGHALPYAAALYRIDQAGVHTVWSQTGAELSASVFAGHLLVEFHYDPEYSVPPDYKHYRRFEVYSLDTETPKLLYRHQD